MMSQKPFPLRKEGELPSRSQRAVGREKDIEVR